MKGQRVINNTSFNKLLIQYNSQNRMEKIDYTLDTDKTKYSWSNSYSTNGYYGQ